MSSLKLCLIILFCSLVFIEARNPYNVLGVPSYSSFKQIKAAYKKLVLENHPDKNRYKNTEELKERMIEINEAYEAIKETRKVDDSDEDDNHIFNLIIESVCMIFLVVLFNKIQLLVLKFLVWFIEFLSYYVIWIMSVYHVMNRFFAHHFESEELMNSVSIVIGIGLSFALGKYLRSNKNKDKSE